MEPLYRQLIGFTQQPSTRPRWIIAPSLAVGHTLAERLALDGYGWTNLRFTTAVDLAARIAGPALASAGVAAMDTGVGPALILQLLLDLGEEVPKYFRGIVEQPGVAEALWRAIDQLRMAGLAAADLRPEAFTSPAKYGGLSAILSTAATRNISLPAPPPALCAGPGLPLPSLPGMDSHPKPARTSTPGARTACNRPAACRSSRSVPFAVSSRWDSV